MQVFEAEQQKLDKNKRDALAKVCYLKSQRPIAAVEAIIVCCVDQYCSSPPRHLSCTSQQEFQAEQDYMKTLSYLSPEEQKKYKERQSVSWLYQKPPGMDAADKPKVRYSRCTPYP